MKKTLVILAAGIGSRFGGGIKQLEPIDDYGHIIMDYCIHDAIAAGFNKIVFIIRHDIEEDFKTIIGDRIEKICHPLGVEVLYAFQEISDIPINVPEGRTKPWGTGHAILACEGLVNEPFAVINADDYYGKNGFKKALETLGDGYAVVGYQLKNTLSENGGVTRGVCQADDGRLKGIVETKNIVKVTNGTDVYAEADGKMVDINSLVSMNFWCYPAEFIDYLREDFPVFLANMTEPLTDEYLLPIIADKMLQDGTVFNVLSTDDKWFGITYKEDRPSVERNFQGLIEDGVYRKDLYSDL